MMRIVLLLAVMAAYVHAACDNHCSGHGTCGTDDVCTCYDNWGIGQAHDSGDCSERVCPYELAWVDTPDKQGKFHKYVECAGRGLCDRATGECQCFDGYEGKGCARTTCPNDCSGHGTCEYIEDMSYGATWTDYSNIGFNTDPKTFEFSSWDAGKTRGCVCDATFGDVDCSKRLCPYGNDVLDVRDDLTTTLHQHVQQLTFVSNYNKDATQDISDLDSETFALTFTSKLNETFTTIPIVFSGSADSDDMKNDIQLALLSLPNKVIDGVTVSIDRTKSTEDFLDGNYAPSGSEKNILIVKITFTGSAVQGRQNWLTVEDYECSSGCTPKLTGLSLNYKYDHFLSNITAVSSVPNQLRNADADYQGQFGDYNSYECGRRGKCDYETGLCQCFAGYFGDNCNTLTTLV